MKIDQDQLELIKLLKIFEIIPKEEYVKLYKNIIENEIDYFNDITLKKYVDILV